MTTYRTGNPIGSTDPRDLYDNAENLDVAVNDTSRDTWSDRLGRSRKTMSGMEREFNTDQASRDDRFNTFIASSGYQFLSDYAAGIEITEYNQIVRDADGEFWRLSGQVELPYTTTGGGLPEGDALTPLGDAVLRQQLSGDVLTSQGARLVGGAVFSVGTVDELLSMNTSGILEGQVAFAENAFFEFSGGVFNLVSPLGAYGDLQSNINNYHYFKGSGKRNIDIDETLAIPITANYIDMVPTTIRQSNGVALPEMLNFFGYGNEWGYVRVRVDGGDLGRDVTTGVVFRSGAGDLMEYDVSGKHLKTVVELRNEVEHANVRVWGRQSGTLLYVNGTVGTPDENSYEIRGATVDTGLLVRGNGGTSAEASIFLEGCRGWIADIESGTYLLSGLTRTAGLYPGGGGFRITGQTQAIVFKDYRILAGPGAAEGAVGVYADYTGNLRGTIHISGFDIGAVIKKVADGSSFNLFIGYGGRTGEGAILGSFSEGSRLNACSIDITVAGGSADKKGLVLDYVERSTININGRCTGGVLISENSRLNTIYVDHLPSVTNSDSITNERSECDNSVVYRGSRRSQDILSLNGGNFFEGMILEEIRFFYNAKVFRTSARYTNAEGWVLDNTDGLYEHINRLSDISNTINGTFKSTGMRVIALPENKEVWASGPNPGDPWHYTDGSGTIEPV